MKKRVAPIKKKDVNPLAPPISLPLPATTTEQEDLTHKGQRNINMVWEFTQAFLALFVTVTVVILGLYLSIVGRTEDLAPFLTLILGIIIGSYFQRTNHTKVGGVGRQPEVKEGDQVGR